MGDDDFNSGLCWLTRGGPNSFSRHTVKLIYHYDKKCDLFYNRSVIVLYK